MRENTLKQRLCAGKAAFGAMCTSLRRRSWKCWAASGSIGFSWTPPTRGC